MILEEDPESHEWAAWCPELNGCASSGLTREEAIEHTEEAIALYLEPLPIETPPGAVELKGAGAHQTTDRKGAGGDLGPAWVRIRLSAGQPPQVKRGQRTYIVRCPTHLAASDYLRRLREASRARDAAPRESIVIRSGKFVLISSWRDCDVLRRSNGQRQRAKMARVILNSGKNGTPFLRRLHRLVRPYQLGVLAIVSLVLELQAHSRFARIQVHFCISRFDLRRF